MRSHLSPLDGVLLELEEADDAAHMQTGWALISDPLANGERPSVERLREQVRERIEETSLLRRRLSMPRVGRLSLPVWLPDPDFDVGQLIRRASLPDPGGEEELLEWLGDHFSHRLDRTRPLWETTLLEGLEGGRWALVCKIHQCLIDGISGATLVAALLDAEPEPEDGVVTLAALVTWFREEAKRGTLMRLRGVVGEAVSGGVDATVHPHKVPEILAQSREMAEKLTSQEPPVPHTSLNDSIGSSRQLAAVEVPLEEVKRVKRELGGTVRDVVLAMTAGGLRRLFEHRGEEVDQVRALVPVSLRQASETLASGQGVSSLFVDLPVAEPDPMARYRRIVAATEEMKSDDLAPVAGTAAELAGLAPSLIQSVVARLAFTPGLFNVTVTGVYVSPIPLYALGGRLHRAIPTIPISSGYAVGVVAMTADGKVYFGLNADRDSVPDLAVMQRGIEDSLTELQSVSATI